MTAAHWPPSIGHAEQQQKRPKAGRPPFGAEGRTWPSGGANFARSAVGLEQNWKLANCSHASWRCGSAKAHSNRPRAGKLFISSPTRLGGAPTRDCAEIGAPQASPYFGGPQQSSARPRVSNCRPPVARVSISSASSLAVLRPGLGSARVMDH